jgi:hypothetical protein
VRAGSNLDGMPVGTRETVMYREIVRRRRPLLIAAAVVTVALGLVAAAGAELVAALISFVLVFGLFVLALAALRWRRPAELEIKDSAFVTLVHPQPIVSAVAFTLLGGNLVQDDVADALDGDAAVLNTTLAVAYILLIAMLWYLTWSPPNLRLTPGGLDMRRAFGSCFVPWEALDPARPISPERGTRLALRVVRPELVTRRGLVSSSYVVDSGTDPAFLTAVITEYVAEPERRVAIGTAAELDRYRV